MVLPVRFASEDVDGELRAVILRLAPAGRIIWPIVVAVLISWLSWQFVGKPHAERVERRTDQRAARAELQSRATAFEVRVNASIEAFTEARPNDEAIRQQALDLWRAGQELTFVQGEHARAIDQFQGALTVLRDACPGCPGILVTP